MTIGAVAMIRKNFSDALLCLIPIAAVLSASSLRLYPFATRTIAFLTPIIILLVIQGCQWSILKQWPLLRKVVICICTSALLLTCFIKSAPIIKHFSFGKDIRPLMYFLKTNFKNGDSLYVNTLGLPTYAFYNYLIRERTDLMDYAGIIGDAMMTISYQGADLQAIAFYPKYFDSACAISENNMFFCEREDTCFHFSQERNWFIFAHAEQATRLMMISYLDHIGKQLIFLQGDDNAFLYLYEIKGPNACFLYTDLRQDFTNVQTETIY